MKCYFTQAWALYKNLRLGPHIEADLFKASGCNRYQGQSETMQIVLAPLTIVLNVALTQPRLRKQGNPTIRIRWQSVKYTLQHYTFCTIVINTNCPVPYIQRSLGISSQSPPEETCCTSACRFHCGGHIRCTITTMS